MAEKMEGPFKELPYKKVLDALVNTSKTQGTDIKQLNIVKKTMASMFGKVQTQAFFDSLPKSAYPQDKNAAKAKFYAQPKAKTTGNNKGGLTKSRHNDMRKGGLFK